jgi:hypothetical protein
LAASKVILRLEFCGVGFQFDELVLVPQVKKIVLILFPSILLSIPLSIRADLAPSFKLL